MQLAKITIATIRTTEMVGFYNAVFDAQLRPINGFNTLVYEGRLSGIRLVLCPYAMFGDVAEPSHQQFKLQQFKFMTPALDPLRQRITHAGGYIERTDLDPFDGSRRLWARDPDGNTIEFEQPCPAKIG